MTSNGTSTSVTGNTTYLDFEFTLSGLAGLDLQYLKLIKPDGSQFFMQPFSLSVDGTEGSVALGTGITTTTLGQTFVDNAEFYLTGLDGIDDSFTLSFRGRKWESMTAAEYTVVGYTFASNGSSPTPEPATMLILGLGLAGLGLARRRK